MTYIYIIYGFGMFRRAIFFNQPVQIIFLAHRTVNLDLATVIAQAAFRCSSPNAHAGMAWPTTFRGLEVSKNLGISQIFFD